MKKQRFKCQICFEYRFVSFTPPCGHSSCGICVSEILSHQLKLYDCTICGAVLSTALEEYKFDFHNFGHLKPGEYAHALVAAISEGKVSLLKQIVNCGFDVKKACSDGKLIFYPAAQGNLEIFKFLENEGADINQVHYGETPLFVAAMKGHLEIVKFLAAQGVDLDTAQNDGMTPLHAAVFEGNYDVVKFLVEQEVDVDKTRNDGVTPLYGAVLGGNCGVVKFLVEQGADVNKADKNGFTPTYIATQRKEMSEGHLEVATYLVNLLLKKQ